MLQGRRAYLVGGIWCVGCGIFGTVFRIWEVAFGGYFFGGWVLLIAAGGVSERLRWAATLGKNASDVQVVVLSLVLLAIGGFLGGLHVGWLRSLLFSLLPLATMLGWFTLRWFRHADAREEDQDG